MIEFSKQISDKWNVSQALSELICTAFEKGDTPYYLAEYSPDVVAELSVSIIWEIFDFLATMTELSSKKKRVLNALKKAEKLTPRIERQVSLISNPFELDDMLIPLRPNPRSKGQLAVKKGLDPLADLVLKQDDEQAPIEDLVEPYIGKDPSLKTADDVLQGVKDLLAERFAYDDTVRAMVREFAYEDGFFDITPKNKKDPDFSQYIGKNVPVHELAKNELLALMVAEDKKDVRLKLGVQLFRVTELLRHHFITNPDASGFDLICQTIDEAWERLLQPIIERDVKEWLRTEAESWASKIVMADLEKKYIQEQDRGPALFIDIVQKKSIIVLAISAQGNLLGTTSEKIPPEGKPLSSERLRQFLVRHRPAEIIFHETENVSLAESIVKQNLAEVEPPIPFRSYKGDPAGKNASESEWMEKNFATLLDEPARHLYGLALMYLQPLTLISQINEDYFPVHPFQHLIPAARFKEIILRIVTGAKVARGVQIKDILDSPFTHFASVPNEILQAIKSADTLEPFNSKNDLLKMPGMKEVIFRNIAGFLLIPSANDLLDRSLVHPDFYPWIYEMSEQLAVSIDTIVSDPGMIRSYTTDDVIRKVYIEKKLIGQVQVAQRFASPATPKIKRKLKLTELKEGGIVSGRVTNITPFGVFININAVCDGLIHISQLADEYVETPDQVVAVGDKVDVRILKVDVKKRRISLSMKNLGNKAPHVNPTKGQLDNLAEYFKNR